MVLQAEEETVTMRPTPGDHTPSPPPPHAPSIFLRVGETFAAVCSFFQPIFLFVLRLYIGYEAAISGWAHLHHVAQTTQFFVSLGIPLPKLNVYISGITELVGGVLLLVGLFSRLISIPLVFNFAVAIITYEASNSRQMLLHPFTDDNFSNVVISDTAFPFFFVSLMILLFGPGDLSLDELVIKPLLRRGRKQG